MRILLSMCKIAVSVKCGNNTWKTEYGCPPVRRDYPRAKLASGLSTVQAEKHALPYL